MFASAGALAQDSAGLEVMLFSPDTGGAETLSDPASPTNGGFESSDVYSSEQGPISWVGADGVIDDAMLIGTDVAPSAPDPARVTAIPFSACGASPAVCFDDYFDLDGLDVVNVDLTTVYPFEVSDPIPDGEHLWKDFSFDPRERRCIRRDRYMAVSFDDDDHASWPAGPSAAPSGSTSPGGATFGSTATADEIVSLVIRRARRVGSGFPTHRLISSSPAAAENHLHGSLAPNPDSGGQEDDDDVDALDVLVKNVPCDVILFSPDHEAHDGLTPGSIYQIDASSSAVAPTELIQSDVHLGLSSTDADEDGVVDVDIDAFELVWMDVASASGPVYPALAVFFSVDGDDPETIDADESGGLVPGTIYGSFLDGIHFEVLNLTGGEDIDALATSPKNLKTWAENRNPEDPN
jgi:hypothetical protein